jgi:hypothetical protein
MNYQELYQVIYNTLSDIIPKDVIDIIIFKYAIYSHKHKYSIDTNMLYYNIYFNKQLGIIYCGTQQYHKLLDYKTGTIIDTSLIGTVPLIILTLEHIRIHEMIYFDSDTIITSDGKTLIKYIKNTVGYVDSKFVFLPRKYRSVYIHNNHMYILLLAQH